jgi:hypothetical protein
MEPLDQYFLLHYALRRQKLVRSILEGVRPVMIRIDDRMIFLHRGRKDVATIRPERYQRAKELSHVPLALQLWLSEHAAEPLSSDMRSALAAFESRLQHELATETGPGAEVLRASAAFVQSLLARAAIDAESLLVLARSVTRPTRALMLDATREELAALDRVVAGWTRDFSAQDWVDLRVLICANHQARYRESATLYFERLLAERQAAGARAERRLIYAENARTEEEAISLLATHELDQLLAAVFLGDPYALQQNVLGDEASAVVRELLPDEPNPNGAGKGD